MSQRLSVPYEELSTLDRAVRQRSHWGAGEPSRIVIIASEHETVDLPTDVFESGGRLDLYQDVLKLFQVRFRNGVPVLQMDRYVGYIPLNDRYAVEVQTRVPVGNLERLVGRASGYAPLILQRHLRKFSPTDERPTSFLDALAARLLNTFSRLYQTGLLSTYRRRERIGSSPIGKVRPFESAWRTQKAGRPIAVSSSFYRTHDFAPNRIIALALERLLRQFLTLPEGAVQADRKFQLRQACERLEGINPPSQRELSPGAIATLLENLPSHHEQYADAILLSQLVLADAGLAIRERGSLTVLPSILIDMEKVFEEYARKLLLEGLATRVGISVKDGNKEGEQGARTVLFADVPKGSANSVVTPDIVIENDGTPSIIIDAKYKPSRGLPDRTDLNQVITYGTRYNCPRVMLLHASRNAGAAFVRTVGKVGTVEILLGSINLKADNMEAEENGFIESIGSLL